MLYFHPVIPAGSRARTSARFGGELFCGEGQLRYVANVCCASADVGDSQAREILRGALPCQ
jgi:hypothetical protein